MSITIIATIGVLQLIGQHLQIQLILSSNKQGQTAIDCHFTNKLIIQSNKFLIELLVVQVVLPDGGIGDGVQIGRPVISEYQFLNPLDSVSMGHFEQDNLHILFLIILLYPYFVQFVGI